MSEQPLYSVSVAGVVIDDRRRVLLMQRRDNGRWEPPGGILEMHETVHDGLRREIREETGLEVEPETLTGVYKNMARGIVALVFRCRVTGGQLSETGEAIAFRWAWPEELGDLMVEAFAIRIRDGLRDDCPAVREHDGFGLL